MGVTISEVKRFKNIIFAGFFAFTKSEKEILHKIAALPNAKFLFHKGPGLSGNLDFLGSFNGEAGEQLDWRGRVKFHKASDLHGEIFALNKSLSTALEKEKSFSSQDVIVMPDAAALFPLMNWTLPLAKGNFNVSMGYPLVASPFYSMIEGLFTLNDRSSGRVYQIDAYKRFILHPYIKNIECKNISEISRVIFHGIEEVLSHNLTKAITLENIEKGSYTHGKSNLVEFIFSRLSSYPEIKSHKDVRDHIKYVHDSTIRPFEKIENMEDFVVKLLALISLISQKSTANLHVNYDMFVRSLIQSLHKLKVSRLAGMKFESKSSYFRLLRYYLGDASAHFSGTPLKGLQALGFLETRGLKFNHVWFLDANEGVIPNVRKEDSLLPYKLKQALGLPTHKTREDIFKYYFTVLLGQAGSVNLFYLDTPDHEPSRFVRRIMWDMQVADKKYGIHENEVRFPVSFARGEPSSVKKTPEMLRYVASNVNISPSNLDNYLACPLKFYYGSVLGFDKKEGFSSDFEAKDIGILVHDILKSFFSCKTGAPLSINAGDYALIEAATDKCFSEKYSSIEDGFGYIIKSRIKNRLKDVLREHENLLPLEILCVEKRMEVPYKSGSFNIRLVGKIDRIDKRNGKIWVIDYKSGTSASLPSHEDSCFANRESWPKKIKSVQLPFYILLYMLSNTDTDINSMEASLMLLGKMNEKMEVSLFTRVVRRKELVLNKVKYFHHLRAMIDTLIAEIFNVDLPFVPTSDTETCANCDFKLFCDRQWAVKPKRY